MTVYTAAMAELPEHESVDIPTSFGTVRTYRFEGPADRTPIVLLHGRSASTPMWRANIPSLTAVRPVVSVDLLGEPGMSVQDEPISGAADEARWLDEALTGLGLDRVHLLGVSIGGWTAASHAVHRPGRAASLTLLDPAMTFARLPVKTVLATLPLVVPWAPEALRRRVLSWIAGGADVDDTQSEAALISAGSTDFVLAKPPPTLFTDEQLRALDAPGIGADRRPQRDPRRRPRGCQSTAAVAVGAGRAVAGGVPRDERRVRRRDRPARAPVLGRGR